MFALHTGKIIQIAEGPAWPIESHQSEPPSLLHLVYNINTVDAC